MSIHQLNFEGKDKVEQAISFVKMFEPTEGYYLAFSGGKDSIVVKKLLQLAGVKFEAHYNVTTVDPKELIYYMREHHKDTIYHNPEVTMWQLIPKKLIPPTRQVRYCCEVLKEGGGEGRFVVTGVRKAESPGRAKRGSIDFDAYGSNSKQAIERRKVFLNSDNDERRRMIESCVIKGKNIINPILDWEDDEVWEFIREYNLPYCELYDKGYKRLGCLGCPLGTNQKRELKDNPKVKLSYVKAFDRMIQERNKKGMETQWKDGEEVLKWWTGQK